MSKKTVQFKREDKHPTTSMERKVQNNSQKIYSKLAVNEYK